jgi:hypothetical protein
MSKPDEIEQSEPDRHGIETVPANFFLWGGFRYSNARDALAAAKRGVDREPRAFPLVSRRRNRRRSLDWDSRRSMAGRS